MLHSEHMVRQSHPKRRPQQQQNWYTNHDQNNNITSMIGVKEQKHIEKPKHIFIIFFSKSTYQTRRLYGRFERADEWFPSDKGMFWRLKHRSQIVGIHNYVFQFTAKKMKEKEKLHVSIIRRQRFLSRQKGLLRSRK